MKSSELTVTITTKFTIYIQNGLVIRHCLSEDLGFIALALSTQEISIWNLNNGDHIVLLNKSVGMESTGYLDG